MLQVEPDKLVLPYLVLPPSYTSEVLLVVTSSVVPYRHIIPTDTPELSIVKGD